MDDVPSIIFLLLLVASLFSAAETAFFSLTKIHIKKLEKDNDSKSKRILKLLKKPKQLLITTLFGNTIVNISATSLATVYAINISRDLSKTMQSLVMTGLVVTMTLLIIVFCEIIPKLYAFSMPVRVANFTSFLLISTRFIFFPIIIILEWFIIRISKKKDITSLPQTSLSHEDIINIVQSDSDNHPLEENEKQIIDKIFRFPSTVVKEIMVPRVDITGIEILSSIEEAKKIIVDSGYSRIPVYKKSIDEIVGIIYAKDFIFFPEKTSLQNIQRKVVFIPENMKIQTLLNQFQNKKKQIAIVVDEYGGTSGLVTLEDILEEIVGEIMDEYDEEQPKITKLDESNYLISAMIQVSELNREFNLSLNEEFENLAELLYSELNHIPHKNEKYIFENTVEFMITQLKKQRIDFVKMKLINNINKDLHDA